MAPDLNSLPPSRSSTSSPLHARNNWSSTEGRRGSDRAQSSSRSSSVAPAAAAMNNSGSNSHELPHRSSLSGGHRSLPPSSRPSISEGRRRSHMNLNDSPLAAPAPAAITGGVENPQEHRSPSFGNYFRTASPSSLGGSPIIATGDPHHHRAPSLGELHQELEEEQEAQVNRLLQMIRQQQVQLQQLQLQQQQQQQGLPSASGTAVVDENNNNNSTPNSERSHHQFPAIPPLPTPGISRSSTIHSHHSHSHSPFSNRRGSRGSETASAAPYQPYLPTATPTESVFDFNDVFERQHEPSSTARRGSLDESAYYQAEIASLNRDNRMLRTRIRVLERQIAELSAPAPDTVNPAAQSSQSNAGSAAGAAGASAGAGAGEDSATRNDAETRVAVHGDDHHTSEKEVAG